MSMNTGFVAAQVSLRFVIESSDHSVSNHLPLSRHISGFFIAGLTGPHFYGRPFEGQASLGLRHFASRLATTAGRIEFTCVTD